MASAEFWARESLANFDLNQNNENTRSTLKKSCLANTPNVGLSGNLEMIKG